MQLEPIIDAIIDDVTALSSLGDPAAAEAGRRVAGALAPALRVRLLDLLAQASVEVSAGLPAGHIEVRLAGQEPTLLHVGAPQAPDTAPAGTEELSARLTLRLSETLKDAVDRAADREGMSVNGWVVRALKR